MARPTDPINQERSLTLSLTEVTSLLIKHYDLHEGMYDVAIELKIAAGAIGPSPESSLPGAMFGVSGIGLQRTETPGPRSINAAEVNPVKKQRKPRATKK